MSKIVLIFCFLLPFSAVAQKPFWVQTNGPSGGGSRLLFDSEGDIYCITRHLLRSSDDAQSWIDITPDFLTGVQDGMVSSANSLYILSGGSLHRSTDLGTSWNIVLKNISVGSSLYASKTGPLYVVDPFGTGAMWRSLDDGITWQDISSAMPPRVDANFFVMPTGELIFVDYEKTHFYYSMDNGTSWTQQSTPLLRLTDIQGTKNGDLFSGFALPDYATDVLHAIAIRSTDNGKTWDSIRRSFNLIITSNDIIAGTENFFLYSSDSGNSWNTQFLPDISDLNYGISPDLKGNIYWSIPERTTRYSTATKSLEEISIPIGSVNNILIDTDGTIISRGQTSFSLSKDKGQTWSTVTGSDGPAYPGKFGNIAKDSNGGMIGLNYDGLYRSTDQGLSWSRTDSMVWQYTQSNPPLLVTPNGSIFTGTSDNTIFRSTDAGKTWSQSNTGTSSLLSPAIACDLHGMLYLSSGQDIYRSSDNGSSWQLIVTLSDPFLFKGKIITSNLTCLTVTNQGEIFAGTSHDGVIASSNQGVAWNIVNEHLDSAHIAALFAAPNGDVYGISSYGSLDDGIIYRPYHATRWYNANDGLGNTGDLTTMAFASDGTAYLGTNGRGVWRGQGVVNAVTQHTDNSENLSLQISPNPASSEATITYSLPEGCLTNLELCDAVGRTLKHLDNGFQDGGVHNQVIHFNGLPDGVYLIRLNTPEKSFTEKIIIEK